MSKESFHDNERERKSPQQMNAELNALFGQLPQWEERRSHKIQKEEDVSFSTLPQDKKEYLEELGQDDNSRQKKLLMERVTKLTQKAPITDSFRKYITHLYSEISDLDISSEEEEKKATEDTFFFLDRGNPNSGGIFDQKRALEHEYEALARVKKSDL